MEKQNYRLKARCTKIREQRKAQNTKFKSIREMLAT